MKALLAASVAVVLAWPATAAVYGLPATCEFLDSGGQFQQIAMMGDEHFLLTEQMIVYPSTVCLLLPNGDDYTAQCKIDGVEQAPEPMSVAWGDDAAVLTFPGGPSLTLQQCD